MCRLRWSQGGLGDGIVLVHGQGHGHVHISTHLSNPLEE
jgi:hypothetical protein